MAGGFLKKTLHPRAPLGPAKPTKPGLTLGTRTTEIKPPTLTPRWGNSVKQKSEQAPVTPSVASRKSAIDLANAGLSSERTRERMVDRLRRQGITHSRVIAAMQQVPRHAFVDQALASRAYEDTALPIGHNQTISQPYVVARVIELALTLLTGEPRALKALEVGGGCGYQAAVMSYCFDRVVSVERIKALADLARANLRPLKRMNLKFVHGDGLIAAATDGPFDVIVCSAGMSEAPPELLAQLAVGGVMVAPIGSPEQHLVATQRLDETQYATQSFDMVRYVPVLRGVE